MRVLFTSCYNGVVGGAEAYQQTVMRTLRDQGHEIGLLYEFDVGEATRFDYDKAWCLTSADEALTSVRQWRPSVVFANRGFTDPSVDAEIATIFPALIFVHDFHGMCLSGRKSVRRPQMKACTRSFGAGCLAAYPLLGCGGHNPLTMLRQYRVQRHRQQSLSLYKHIVVASHFMQREMETATSVKSEVIPYPVASIPFIDPASISGKSHGAVAFMGRLLDLKGVHHIADIVRRAAQTLRRPLTLHVLGDGPGSRSLQESHDLLHVIQHGWLKKEEQIKILDACDALLIPSIWPEPFGMVGIEAGARGVPSIAYNAGGISEWLDHGRGGFLVPPEGGVEEMARSLGALLANSDRLVTFRNAALAGAMRFTVEAHFEKLLPLMQAVESSA